MARNSGIRNYNRTYPEFQILFPENDIYHGYSIGEHYLKGIDKLIRKTRTHENIFHFGLTLP